MNYLYVISQQELCHYFVKAMDMYIRYVTIKLVGLLSLLLCMSLGNWHIYTKSPLNVCYNTHRIVWLEMNRTMRAQSDNRYSENDSSLFIFHWAITNQSRRVCLWRLSKKVKNVIVFVNMVVAVHVFNKLKNQFPTNSIVILYIHKEIGNNMVKSKRNYRKW